MTFIYIYVFAQTVRDLILIDEYGRLGMMLSTFFFWIIMDQIKSFFTLGIVYIVVVRRFMYLSVNEDEYMDPVVAKLPKLERAIPKLKEICLKYLESPPTEIISMIIISVYALFVIFWLIHIEFVVAEPGKEKVSPIPESILISIDIVFLSFFMLEIVLKSFASNGIYM